LSNKNQKSGKVVSYFFQHHLTSKSNFIYEYKYAHYLVTNQMLALMNLIIIFFEPKLFYYFKKILVETLKHKKYNYG